MLQIQIPRDIRDYEPKFVGPFTMRQCICIVAAASIELAGSTLMKTLFEDPKMTFIPPLFIAFIPIIFGFGEDIFHMKPEVYFREVFLRALKYPSIRPYKTHNYIDVELRKLEAQRKREEEQKKGSEKSKTDKKAKKPHNKELPEELRAYQ